MSCCCGHHHHDCPCHSAHHHCGCHSSQHHCSCHSDHPEPRPFWPWRHGFPSREEYIRMLDEEREVLEWRLRHLEQELEELRKEAHPKE